MGKAAKKGHVVLIRNLSNEVQDENVQQLLSAFGLLVGPVQLHVDQELAGDGGKQEQVLKASARFEEVEDAAAAVDNLHGATYFGRTIIVQYGRA